MSVVTPQPNEASHVPVATRLFRNGNSQAVRIPMALAFESVDIEVEIERRGDELIVRPAKRKLTQLGADFRKLRRYFVDFRRDQPLPDTRDWATHGARKDEQ